MKIYLVGGCVRDKLLGKKCKDRDFVVFGCSEEEFFKRFPRAKKVGKKVPVYLVGRNEYTISEYDNIMDDLMSRDLTINAIAEDENKKLYYHPFALDDLENKILRAISLENFKKDPLRVLRLARFYAQLPDFSIEKYSYEILKKVGRDESLMKRVAKERVAQEVLKAIRAKKPSNFFSLLMETGATSYWFSELQGLKENKEWMAVMDTCNANEICAWMCLAYGFVKNYDNINNAIQPFKNMSKKIGLPKKIISGGVSFIKNYLNAMEFFSAGPDIKRDLLYSLDREGLVESFFYVMEKITKNNYMDMVNFLLMKIKQIKLPDKYKGLGPESGEILRNMQIKEIEKWSNS